MDFRKKYLAGSVDNDIMTSHVVRILDAAVNGQAECKHVFKMFRDEDVKSVLDDNDYKIWQKLKADRA